MVISGFWFVFPSNANHVPINHIYIFLKEISTHVLCFFFSWVVWAPSAEVSQLRRLILVCIYQGATLQVFRELMWLRWHFSKEDYVSSSRMFWVVFCLFVCLLVRAAPMTYGSSQARGPIRATAAGLTPQPQQLAIRATSVTYTTPHSHAGSLTHWARPQIEPTSPWILGGFISTEPQRELQDFY